MSTFHLTQFSDTPPTTEATWALNRDEAATIWYALSSYKASLVKSAAEADDTSNVEDQAFLYDTASKVAKLMFELRDDHSPAASAERIHKWLDTD